MVKGDIPLTPRTSVSKFNPRKQGKQGNKRPAGRTTPLLVDLPLGILSMSCTVPSCQKGKHPVPPEGRHTRSHTVQPRWLAAFSSQADRQTGRHLHLACRARNEWDWFLGPRRAEG